MNKFKVYLGYYIELIPKIKHEDISVYGCPNDCMCDVKDSNYCNMCGAKLEEKVVTNKKTYGWNKYAYENDLEDVFTIASDTYEKEILISNRSAIGKFINTEYTTQSEYHITNETMDIEYMKFNNYYDNYIKKLKEVFDITVKYGVVTFYM